MLYSPISNIMKIAPFATEHFYAEYEFNTPYQLCNSDCETMTVIELLETADLSLAQLGQLSLGYTEAQGNPHLREIIAETCATAQAFVWRRPLAGSTALVEMNVPSVEAYTTRLAQEAGILIHPATTLGGTDRMMRMGFGRAAFGEALTQFEAYLYQEQS